MEARAILYGSAIVLGLVVGAVIVKSVAWLHPLSLAAVYVTQALQSALR